MNDEMIALPRSSSFTVHRSSFNVVVHTPDVVGARMAGPGIRAWYLARELAKVAPTTLVATVENLQESHPFDVVDRRSDDARRVLREASVLIGQPVRGFRRKRRRQRIVFDLFDPVVLELRELYGHAPSLRQRIHIAAEWMRLLHAMRDGDLLIRAAPMQKEFYERLQSSAIPWVEVSFGIDTAEISGCEKPKDNLIVWGGGVWEWLDPLTAVDAVKVVNRRGLHCRILFLGRTRPQHDRIDRRRDARFVQLIERGAPYASAHDDWVPYRERLAWLRAAKIAMMLHRPTVEAEFSIRTRVFDAIAAGVPIVATEKGFAAELVAREGLGVVVPPLDVEAVASGVERLLLDDVFHAACVHNLERLRPRFTWEAVTRPLIDKVNEWQTQV